jgi:hypothetical protein
LIADVPESFSTITYRTKLEELSGELATLPTGRATSRQFEELIGNVIKLCFFRSLHNVEPRVRNADTTAIRDWIASNRAPLGFWAIVRDKYSATQVIWECKNYTDIKADDFNQALYYMNDQTGRFLIMVILRESDIKTFLRQALNGKRSEQHLQDLFDNTERLIS